MVKVCRRMQPVNCLALREASEFTAVNDFFGNRLSLGSAIWLTAGICTLTGILEGKRWLERDARTRILADMTAVYLFEIVAALAFITYDSM